MSSLPDTPGLRLISSGLSYCKAAELLHLSDPNSVEWAPCFAIVGLAIEVGLKGYLREHGMSEAQQRRLGHDLADAFRQAVSHGFKPSHPLQEALAVELSPHYKDMSLRYQIGASLDLPVVKDVIEVARSLIHDLYVQTRVKYPSP